LVNPRLATALDSIPTDINPNINSAMRTAANPAKSEYSGEKGTSPHLDTNGGRAIDVAKDAQGLTFWNWLKTSSGEVWRKENKIEVLVEDDHLHLQIARSSSDITTKTPTEPIEEPYTLKAKGEQIANFKTPKKEEPYQFKNKIDYIPNLTKNLLGNPNTPLKDKEIITKLDSIPAKKEYNDTESQPSLLQEATNTLKNEGVGNFISQVGSKISNVIAENFGGKEDIVIETKEDNSLDHLGTMLGYKKLQQYNKPDSVKFTMPQITILGDTIPDKGDKVFVPLALNTEKNTFDYRNRGEDKNIIGSKGAMLSTYNPFFKTSEYLTAKNYNFYAKATKDDSVIALDTKTGKVTGGKFKDFENNPDMVVSQTLPAKRISGIKISKDNSYFEGIAQRGIHLKRKDGSEQSIPIGIGADNSGKRLTGWSGGKMFITQLNGSNGFFVYGTAEQLKRQLEEYKKINEVDEVLWYDLDQKAFSQAYQTKSGKITKEELKRMDNTNSSGGNVLYLQ